jgi:hypothetical protein
LQRTDRGIERALIQMHQGRIVLAAVYRQAPEPAQKGAREGLIEERGLGERPRGSLSRPEDHQRIDERVRMVRRNEHGAVHERRTRALHVVEDRDGPTDEFRDDPWQQQACSPLRSTARKSLHRCEHAR